MSMQKVLIPLDNSEFSRQILPQVNRFLNPVDNELIILHVAPSKPTYSLSPAPPQPASEYWPVPMPPSHQDADFTKHPIYDSQTRESLIIALEKRFKAEIVQLQKTGYTVSTVVKFGDPAQEILNFVEEEPIDLVAMSTHGRTGPSKIIFGSVAEKVLRKASVPLLLLRPDENLNRVNVKRENHVAKKVG